MAWKIQKSSQIIEDLELTDADGHVEACIHVEVDVDRIASAYRKAELAIAEAEQAVKAKVDDAYTKYGEAVLQLYTLIFGAEDTERIVEFFDGRYTAMMEEINPFIVHVVAPAIREKLKNHKQSAANHYKMNRAQRRRFFS